jgi:hypothetical protein
MAKIKRYTEIEGGYHGELAFMCPGCKCKHFINDSQTEMLLQPDRPIWGFNGDFENPTITPSVLTKYPVLNEDNSVNYNTCHSFVTNGMIQFLGDCQHELAGQTVELPEIS